MAIIDCKRFPKLYYVLATLDHDGGGYVADRYTFITIHDVEASLYEISLSELNEDQLDILAIGKYYEMLDLISKYKLHPVHEFLERVSNADTFA